MRVYFISAFCLGFPGFFGRNFLLLATQLTDDSMEKIFNIDINPFKILYRVFRNVSQSISDLILIRLYLGILFHSSPTG